MEINIGQVLTANKHMIACILSNIPYVHVDTEGFMED